MNSYTKRHRIWLKAIATVVVCLFVFNDLAYPLSAYTRFKPLIITEGKGFKEDAGFLYLSNLIGQALNIERKINGEITPEVIKMLTKKHLRAIDFTRFKWKELYREGKAFCLPYVRKEDGGTQILKYFHPDDISAEFPHKILFQFEDGTKVILEDPLKDEGEGSSEFSLELDQMAADIAAGRFDDIAAGRDEKFKRVPDEELPPRIKKGMGKPSLTIRGVYEYTGGKLGLRVLKKGVRNIDVLKGFFRTRSRWRCPTFFRDHDDEHVYELDLLPLGYRNLKDIAGEYAENLPSGWREKIRQAIASALRRDGEWFGHGHMHSGNIMVKTDEAGDLVDIKLIDWKQLRRQKIREELKEFIEGSRQSLEGLYFEGFALEGFDFRGRNLTSASFLACNLNWADFRGANLELTRMRFSDLRNADFTGARFSGSDLEATMFGGADLTDADLKSCKLSGALFAGANLDHTDFRGSFLDGIAWENALMKNTKFDKYMGEKLEKYRFQVKYIEDYCEATSPDLDVTRLERLVRDAAIGSIPEFRAKQVAGYFLPYKEMDDDFLIKAIRKCLYEDPYFSISNFDLESKEREALREGIPLIVNEARDEVVVKTYGIGRRAIDLQQVVKMLIDHLEECGKKINIRLIGYDISERSLDFSRYPMKIFIESLPAAWRERISYEVYYGDLKERKCWPMMTVDPLADISIKRHTWIHLERDPLSNLREER
ncbi:MAG: pentapeptide repeat-containing protein, partial [Candidatus Omnitrophota bacterium]